MRKDISPTIVSALDNPQGAAVTARLRVGRARHFSTEINQARQAAFAQVAGIVESPVPQDVCVCGEQVLTAMLHEGTLWLARSHEAVWQVTLDGNAVTCDPVCRPGVMATGGQARVFFYENGSIWAAMVDLEAEEATERIEIASVSTPIHIHVIDLQTLALLWLDEGGVRAGLLEASEAEWTLQQAPGRFMFPGTAVGEGWEPQLNYSAAVGVGPRIFVYLTTPTGSVMGMSYHRTRRRWSNTFEAITSDLSRFAVAKAVTYLGQVLLSGQFRREDPQGEFVSNLIYGLLLPSADGKSFALDRTTVFTGGYDMDVASSAQRWFGMILSDADARYGCEAGKAAAIYSACNAWMALPAHFGLTQAVDELLIERVIGIRGNLDSSVNIALPNGNGENDGIFRVGDVVDIEVGVETALNETEWFRLARTAVASVSQRLVDAGSTLNVTVQALTTLRLAGMTYPFTVALMGRETVRDRLDNFEQFERAKDDGYVPFPFVTDFWDAGEKETGPKTHNAGETYEFKSGDLRSTLNLVDYPEISELPLHIRLFGWSRSGKPTPNDGTTGDDKPSNLDAPNDRVVCRLYVLRDTVEITVDVATVEEGSFDHFPQTWLRSEEGAYPLLLSDEAGLQVGDKIKRVGMVFINDQAEAAETVFAAERVEIGNLTMNVESFDETWEAIKASEEAPDAGQQLKRVGTPVVYFSQRPYYAINGCAAAKYELSGEGACGGVVMLASDAKNYVAARAQPGKVELIRVRNGKANVLAQAVDSFPTPGWIMLRHVDGLFEIRVQNVGTKMWSGPVVSYAWKAADGPLLSDPLVSHMGIYALLDTPYVRIAGFDPKTSDRAGALPGAHLWGEFPYQGTIQIEDNKYAYGGTVSRSGEVLGPYQGRNVGGPYKYANDGATYRGRATEFIRFEWLHNGEHWSDFAGDCLATDTGIVWPITRVDFKPFITTKKAKVYLKNRGRFFSPEAEGDVIGKNVAVWITHVFLGLAQLTGERTSHEKGSVAYLVGDATVKLFEFAAASGYDDLTDRDAIEKISQTAGGRARFPGDVYIVERVLNSSPWMVEHGG